LKDAFEVESDIYVEEPERRTIIEPEIEQKSTFEDDFPS